MSEKTNIMQLNKPLFDEIGWDEFLRQNADIIEGYVGQEHNADGTHKSINTPEVNTSVVRFADGSSANTGAAVAGAGTLQDVITAGSTANTSLDLIVRNAGGTQELLNVSATKGLQGMLGNINDPLVQIPMRRANDATRLSGVETFTRASTGTYIDPFDGLLKTAAIDEQRHERMADGGVGRLLEGTSTNLCLYSQDFTNAAWTVVNMTTVPSADTTVAPDGTTTADSLTFDATPTSYIYQLSIGAAGTHTVSVWAKVSTGTKSFRLRTYTAAEGSLYSQDFTATTTWQRFTFTFTVSSSMEVHVMNNSAGTAGTLEVWGYQVEALPFASSYIPTTGTAVTRAADNLSIAVSGNILTPSSSGTLIFDADCLDESGGTYFRPVSIENGGVSDALRIAYNGTDDFHNNGTVWIDHVTHQLPRVSVVFNGTNKKLFVDNVLKANRVGGTYVGIFPSSPTIINIGKFGAAASYHYGHVRNLRIYDRALTDQEIGAA